VGHNRVGGREAANALRSGALSIVSWNVWSGYPCFFIQIEIAIGIEIEIVCTIGMDCMLLANLVAPAAETAEQRHDSSIPISISMVPTIPPIPHAASEASQTSSPAAAQHYPLTSISHPKVQRAAHPLTT